MGAVMTTPRYPDRDAMICRMWRQGKAIELIQAAVEKLPGGAGLKARRLANIAGQYKVQRPSWYMRDVVATNGKKGAQNGGWRPEEDALAEELHRAGASARQIGVELGKLTQGRRRGPSSVRRRLLALELITEAAAPPPEVVYAPAPLPLPRVVRIYRAPEPPPSPEPWRALKKPLNGGYSMLRPR